MAHRCNDNLPETVQINLAAPQPLSRDAFFAKASLLPGVASTPRIVLGTAGLGGVWGMTDEDKAIRTMHAAWDAGFLINDSSYKYAEGRAETLLSKAIKQRGHDDVVVLTKIESLREDGESWARSFARQWESIQQRIDYPVTGLAMHDPENAPDEAFAPACHEFLLSLLERGDVKAIGLGGGGAWCQPTYLQTGRYSYMITFRRLTAVSVQAMADTVPVAQQHGTKVLCASPVFMGLLTPSLDRMLADPPKFVTPPFDARAQKLRDLAGEAGLSLSHLALRFALSNPAVDSIITGADDPDTWADTRAAYEAGPLDAELFKQVWHIAQQGEEPLISG